MKTNFFKTVQTTTLSVVVFLALLTIGFVSCQKEEVSTALNTEEVLSPESADQVVSAEILDLVYHYKSDSFLVQVQVIDKGNEKVEFKQLKGDRLDELNKLLSNPNSGIYAKSLTDLYIYLNEEELNEISIAQTGHPTMRQEETADDRDFTVCGTGTPPNFVNWVCTPHIWFYEHCGFAGNNFVNRDMIGNVEVPFIGEQWNDKLSSLKIQAGKFNYTCCGLVREGVATATVIIYEHINFGGHSYSFPADFINNTCYPNSYIDCLTSYQFPSGGNWNDKMSSFKFVMGWCIQVCG